MSSKGLFRKLLLCLVLEAGALTGAAMRPEEIEQLMQMSQPCITQVVRDEKDEPVDEVDAEAALEGDSSPGLR